MPDNLARQGPRKVWSGYKTMRVPKEIFDDVKRFMEVRKQEYLAEQQGMNPEELDIPYSKKYSLKSKEDIQDLIKEAIREEIQELKGSIPSENTVEIPPANLTARERVNRLLKQKPGEEITTIQISDVLELPGATARQATRELAKEDPQITKISGRPNKFRYDP